VEGAVLLPATGFIALALAAGASGLRGLEFHRPLAVPPEGAAVQLIRDIGGGISLHAEAGGEAGWQRIASAQADPADPVTFADIPAPAAAEVLGDAEFGTELAARGFGFGPGFRLVRRLLRDGTVALAELAPPPESGLRPDPALLDAVIQTLTALLPMGPEPWLPAAVGRVVLLPGEVSKVGLRARARLRDIGERQATGDAVLEADGRVVARLEGIVLRPAAATPGAWQHDLVWHPAAAAQPLLGRWHAIGPGAAALRLASADDSGTAPLPPGLDGIIDLRPMAAATPAVCVAEVAELVRRAAALPHPPQLVLVSRGAASAPPVAAAPLAPPAAVLMGLQPTIAAEHPELRCRWVDLDPAAAGPLPPLGSEAGRFAWRHGRLLAPEVVKAASPPPGPCRLAPGSEHSLAGLRLLPDQGRPPGPGEVQIGVHAAGLNFKDALTALGRAPGAGQPLGLECAGTVLATGPGVTGLAAGDPVIGFGPGALASRVTLSVTRVFRRPDWLDAETAASLPAAFLTAWHGLHDLAAVRPGMRVLVHAGAGGVGGAATQLARLAGARVFATTSVGKEAAALAAGAEAVGPSRAPAACAEAARHWAGDAGFDIVLHALGPEMATASAALLRPGGVFLEIGSAGPPAAAQPFRHVAFDLDQPMRTDPSWFADRFARILDLLRSGRLRPPPRTVLPLSRAVEAVTALAQGSSTGKLVLRWPQAPVLRADGSYLVTGGTGAIGRALAEWLAAAGAGRVLLAGRTEQPPTGRFETVAVDVTDRAALGALIAGLPDLRGVIHAAGVVRDRTLGVLAPEEIAAVLAPKVAGAENLDALTRDRPLDFLLLVSSAAGTLGGAGQAAYAGANAWLDRFAAGRRAAGLPATAIGSGPWQAGMFQALDAAARRRLEREEGYRPMPPRRAAAAFAVALQDGAVHRLVMDRAARPMAALPEDNRPAVLLRDFAEASSPERRRLLQAELAARILDLLGFPAGTPLDPDRALRDLGLDSLLSVSLRNLLAADLSLDLPPTLLFDYPTLDALTDHLLALLAPQESPLEELGEAELAALLSRELGVAE
jgi:NADPH:quinone reductase-like Zn-dependent oxidoreductase/acyl carrier protein